MASRGDEFYVGYVPKSPPGIAASTRLVAAMAMVVGVAVGALFVTGQAPFDAGVFEFGVEKSFDGIVVERPYPMLLVPGDRPGGFETHYLVAVGKKGAETMVAGMDGKAVRVSGSLIYQESRRMIEAHAVEPLAGAEADALRSMSGQTEHSLGSFTLTGEIVDSKCHFGVMKPGRGKTHKACAIRCISGGVPPVLRVEDASGRTDYFLLVSADGRPVNRDVLELVAEPVEITGEVVRADDLLVLRADPASYRRVGT